MPAGKSQAARKGNLTQIEKEVRDFHERIDVLEGEDDLIQLHILRDKLQQLTSKYRAEQHGLISSQEDSKSKLEEQEELRVFNERVEIVEKQLTKIISTVSVRTQLNSTPQGGYVNTSGNLDASAILSLLKTTLEQQERQRSADNEKFNLLAKKILEAEPSSSIVVEPVKVPEFDGNYRQWKQFHSVFTALVHNDETISPAQKLSHLKSKLKGVAADTISHLEITNENYAAAWATVKKQFDNKPSIIAAHMDCFMNQQPLKAATAAGVKKLQMTSSSTLQSLSALGVPQSDPWMIHIVCNKLDSETRSLWFRESAGQQSSWDFFEEFLIKRGRELEMTGSSNHVKPLNSFKSSAKPTNSDSKPKVASNIVSQGTTQCPICKKGLHKIYRCKAFDAMAVSKRREIVDSLKICRNCLSDTHDVSQCSYPTCKLCSQQHNRMLHEGNFVQRDSKRIPSTETPSSTQKKTSIQSTQTDTEVISSHPVASSDTCDKIPRVLLATAVVQVEDSFGKFQLCRVLLDSGSQVNLISNNLCQRLRMKPSPANILVEGVGGGNNSVKQRLNLNIMPLFGDSLDNLSVDCLVLKKVTSNQPNWSISHSDIQIPEHLHLADPHWYKNSPIDMLIGAQHFWDILKSGVVELGNDLPSLRETLFGWVIVGAVPPPSPSLDKVPSSLSLEKVTCQVASHATLDFDLSRFFEIEDVPADKPGNSDHLAVESLFLTTTKRSPEGRYIVHLPFNKDSNSLENNMSAACRRFHNLERRLNKNPALKIEYGNIIREYLSLAIVEIVPLNELESPSFYLPHHCVIKEQSSSTKVRIVFNASAKSRSGLSLNDCLMVGPSIQPTLVSILLQFRYKPYAFTCDIVKMYLQVLIHPPHRDYQRFVWRDDSSQNLTHYRFRTVCFGVASSPFLATRVLHQIALDEELFNPLASKALRNNFYVDDCVFSANSIEEAQSTKQQLIASLRQAGMELSKFRSSFDADTQNDDSEKRELLRSESGKTLGVEWDNKADVFGFKLCQRDLVSQAVTKRNILSTVARIFDPIGLVGPVVVAAKIILQEAWLCKVNWDQQLPDILRDKWLKFVRSLPNIGNLQIPRCASSLEDCVAQELHVFSDASMEAFGTCVYLVSVLQSGTRISNLLISKSRVTPVKANSDNPRPLTIPKAELCGAVLATKLVEVVSSAIQISAIYFWCDAEVVIHQIHNSEKKRDVFTRNRVQEILKRSDPVNWRHIPGTENPADILSRGASPDALIANRLWWHGPPWLQESCENWPLAYCRSKGGGANDSPQVTLTLTSKCEFPSIFEQLLSRYSDFDKMKRILAFVKFKVVPAFKNRTMDSPALSIGQSQRMTRQTRPLKISLTVTQIRYAETMIVKWDQECHLSHVIQAVQTNTIDSDRRFKQIRKLRPFLDNQGLLRVGGRLVNADETYDARHPKILPKGSLSILIARREHVLMLHCGPQLMMASLRQRYWPLAGRNLTRKVFRECVTCIRSNPITQCQLMSDLPEGRVNFSRPFTRTGCDFAGPISIKLEGRRAATLKGYIAVFVCFSTKAVHLEALTSLSTEAFISMFRRFVARRGLPAQFYTDNQTTFVGADLELRRAFRDIEFKESLNNFFIGSEIQWCFAPPRGPHHNGLCEAAVRSCKTHLRKVIGQCTLSYEELSTLLCQIEAVLNSRPLVKMSNAINDPQFLSPGHFLTGSALTQLPTQSFDDVPSGRLDKWQMLQKLTQDFAIRWKRDYLHSLQTRSKWDSENENLKVSDIVLIKDDLLPSTHWSLGRIERVFPQQNDEKVRVVEVRTSKGLFKRPVVKLVKLPVNDVGADGEDDHPV
ncbi:uncharacterized protein LOC129808906 [Phlebotomus papatasi]|uniref:uncharacterized protein LOC129808906 n=1 Tax=Phlebotomus papatasi TaxID=29031 RepID=UPI0024845D8B|nr:uncharacterized protein LOC129808906 [Phlebotomus papatasi]